MAKLNRRDFLKLAALVPGAMALSSLAPKTFSVGIGQAASKPNVIIFLFDAMSARNLSLYGYHRETTPNFKRFAERTNVYHAHNSAGNFTTPGAASLFTGLYPWTHRALNMGGLISRNMLDRNIFHFFAGEYTRLAFSQNIWVNYFLNQFTPNLDSILSPAAFSTVSQVIGSDFKDPAAYRAYDDFLFHDGNPPASLVFGLLGRLLFRRQYFSESNSIAQYPNGMPRAGIYPIYFELAKVFDGMTSTIEKLTSPYMAYFHLWAPHAPYRPAKKFMDIFDDNWKPDKKPEHRMSMKVSQSQLNTRRRNYDKYIANIDAEFGRLIDQLEAKGFLDNSYVIVTSDHGEMLERGEDGHVTPLLYAPITQVPLMISAPGQRSRNDIYSVTNSVDVLPTLLHLTGREVPDWCEGIVLPGLGGKDDSERSTFTVEAKSNLAFAPLTMATIAMYKGQHKMIYYTGYEGEDSFELYDMQGDPEELVDIYTSQPDISSRMKSELLAKLDAENQKFKR